MDSLIFLTSMLVGVKSDISKKTLAIPILALAIIGMALAMWSETLLLNVTVETGEVDVKFSDWYCSDTGPDPQAEGFHNEEGKDVASCVIEVETMDDEGDVIKLAVNLLNAYPGYAVEVYLVIDNVGTIPVKLYSSSVEFDEPIMAELEIPENTQIHPGENSTYILKITIPQEAEELSSYTGEVVLMFAQWNEVP
ncbi:MAG: hypothetical protein QW551_04180 [Desulfurococcaceae archaeon]